MSKLTLVVVDANVVIKLHELRLWDRVVKEVDIHVARTVIDECQFWIKDEVRYEINLAPDIQASRITTFAVDRTDQNDFLKELSVVSRGRIDPGEIESLAWLYHSDREYLFATSDLPAYRVLGFLGKGEQGISLEEILDRIGLSCKLEYRFQKKAREKEIKHGEQDRIQGR